MIYYLRLAEHVILLSIYSKSQQDDVSAERIQRATEAAVQEQENGDDDE